MPSSLREEKDIIEVLKTRATAEMVARGDVGGLGAATGITTNSRHLDALNELVATRSRANATLEQLGAPEVWGRLRSGGSGLPSRVVCPELPHGDVGHVAGGSSTRYIAWHPTLATMSVASTCVGTPLYLAPELCEGKEYKDKVSARGRARVRVRVRVRVRGRAP